jgi:hypothetical protein
MIDIDRYDICRPPEARPRNGVAAFMPAKGGAPLGDQAPRPMRRAGLPDPRENPASGQDHDKGDGRAERGFGEAVYQQRLP